MKESNNKLTEQEEQQAIAEMQEVEKIAKEVQQSNEITNLLPQKLLTKEEVAYHKEMQRQSRLYWRVWNHCQAEGNSLEEEYQLILEKKSKMSRSMRDYLQAVMEYEPTEQEKAELEARDRRIKEYQDSMKAAGVETEEEE